MKAMGLQSGSRHSHLPLFGTFPPRSEQSQRNAASNFIAVVGEAFWRAAGGRDCGAAENLG